MSKARWPAIAVITVSVFWLCLSSGESAEQAGKDAVDPKQWDAVVGKAITYLKKTQDSDGSWSKTKSPGCTGIVLTGVLQTGKLSPQDPMVENALKYIESLVNAKAGHLAGQDPKPQLLNYVTSINVMALQAANRPDLYKKVIGNASNFLTKLQWDDSEDKKPEDRKDKKNDFYGGAGYDSKSRPDLSNTQFFLDALQAAGVPKTDPAYKKALVFISRCQNLKGEGNDQPWAGKINDGSFIYSAAGGGQTKVESDTGELIGYGSMTYAGIKSLIYCGVPKGDPRIAKAFEWIQKNYTLDRNPGMPEFRKERGLYYYYHSLAKCLDVMGVDEITTPDGKKHNWRVELIEALAKRQNADGSWTNKTDQWMEGDPNLVTGYVLMTLSHCKPKK
jgi:squalene-hopene/tetraprenyl-beta-curcumene cyclase